MFRSNLQSAFRVLMRRRTYTLINLIGLSIGVISVLLVVLVMHHELSYDSDHTYSDRTYRLAGKRAYGLFATLPIAYSNSLIDGNHPQVEMVTRLRKWPSKFIETGSSKFFEEKVLMTDPGSSFFRIFDFELLEGGVDQALLRPYSIVISEKLANKLFQSTKVLGRTLEYDTMHLTITGVMNDIPTSSHIVADAIITSSEGIQQASGAFTYCVLRPGSNLRELEAALLKLDVSKSGHDALESIQMQLLPDIHFDSQTTFEMKPAGNRLYLVLFLAIGIVVALITVSNYINLSVAMYAERSKEIGVRKTLGGNASGLAWQIMIEGMLIAMLSLPLSIALTDVALPWVNSLMQIDLGSSVLTNPRIALILIAMTALVGFLAALYPSIVIPRFKATTLFKDSVASKNGLSMRKKLVAIQFSLLVLLASCAWIIRQQLNYINEKDLGFTKDGILKLTNAWNIDSAEYQKLKLALLRHPSVASVSHGIVPGDEDYGMPFEVAGTGEVFEDLLVTTSDFEFIPTLNIQILNGGFDILNPPQQMILINETLAGRLGEQDVIGKKIIVNPGKSERERTVAGVFKDIHFFPLQQRVGPHMISLRKRFTGINQNVLVRIQPTGSTNDLLSYVQNVVNDVVPDVPMQVEFLTDDLERHYAKEQNLATLSDYLVTVALITSLIGLIGFTSYLAELRTKEIGIRKILGAATQSIILMMGRTLLVALLAAAAAGSTSAYLLSFYWLQNFAYKITLSFVPFAFTGAGILVLALLINFVQGWKMSQRNPVDSLRYE